MSQAKQDDEVELRILEEEAAIRDRLRVDPATLTEDMSQCPADIAYLGARAARAMLDHGRAKIRSKKTRALAYVEAKQAAEDTYGTRGATVDLVNAMVDQDQRVLDAQEDELGGEVRLAVAKTNVEAAKARRDMLVQMGAYQRAEMERDPVVRRRERED